MKQMDQTVMGIMGLALGSEAIEVQERHGQNELCNSSQLPTDGLKKHVCKAYGIEVVGRVEGDEMFTEVRLPEGWRVERTGHSMWTRLLDERGRERASIFYKASFHDRSAHIAFVRRYTAWVRPVNGYDSPDYLTEPRVGVALDCDQEIFRTERTVARDDFKGAEELQDEVRAWLKEHYPDHEDVTAYWD